MVVELVAHDFYVDSWTVGSGNQHMMSVSSRAQAS